MSIATRTRTEIRHEYAVPSPAAGATLQAAISMAMKEMPEERRAYDDAFYVEARDDEVVIWWPERPVVDQ